MQEFRRNRLRRLSGGKSLSSASAAASAPAAAPAAAPEPAAAFSTNNPMLARAAAAPRASRWLKVDPPDGGRTFWVHTDTGQTSRRDPDAPAPADDHPPTASSPERKSGPTSFRSKHAGQRTTVRVRAAEDDDDDDDEPGDVIMTRARMQTLRRLVRVLVAYPFVLVFTSLNLKFRSARATVIALNFLIVLLPFLIVDGALSGANNAVLVRAVMGGYLVLYVTPVAVCIAKKVSEARNPQTVTDGTFCFRPAHRFRFTRSNVLAVCGILLEFAQHSLYMLPADTLFRRTSGSGSVEAITGLPFKVFFYLVVGAVYANAMVLVLNAVLRGRAHYRFSRFAPIWLFVYFMCGPLFVSVLTVLFQALNCDYEPAVPTLFEDGDIECWRGGHLRMAVASLLALALYLTQASLLPSGTYKETMRNSKLDVMYVPVYHQGHFFVKSLFCAVYVTLWFHDASRVAILLMLSVGLVSLNVYVQPCAVRAVNVLRTTTLAGTVWAGTCSAVTLATGAATEQLLASVVSGWALLVASSVVFFRATTKPPDFVIARTFLELEMRVKSNKDVHPRALENLVSITLGSDREVADIEESIPELVWLIGYKASVRVQFQAIWALANLAGRGAHFAEAIADAGGIDPLIQRFPEMEFPVQLETLAALVNLSHWPEQAQLMLSTLDAAAFFTVALARVHDPHSQFAAMAMANLAATDYGRQCIRGCGGLPALLNLLRSQDYQKQRYACMALANVALTPDPEHLQALDNRRVVRRIVKLAMSAQVEVQRPAAALLTNLAHHYSLTTILADMGAAEANRVVFRHSPFFEVRQWGRQLEVLLDSVSTAVGVARQERHAMAVREAVRTGGEMQPLKDHVTWDTWGSKLDRIFAPVFFERPGVKASVAITQEDSPMDITLVAYDDHADRLTFSILVDPKHGRLHQPHLASKIVTYTPEPGFVGSDMFMFKASNALLSSHAATVAITVTAKPKTNKKGHGKLSMMGRSSRNIGLRRMSHRRHSRVPEPASPSSGKSDDDGIELLGHQEEAAPRDSTESLSSEGRDSGSSSVGSESPGSSHSSLSPETTSSFGDEAV